jgi:hypothetical protein
MYKGSVVGHARDFKTRVSRFRNLTICYRMNATDCSKYRRSRSASLQYESTAPHHFTNARPTTWQKPQVIEMSGWCIRSGEDRVVGTGRGRNENRLKVGRCSTGRKGGRVTFTHASYLAPSFHFESHHNICAGKSHSSFSRPFRPRHCEISPDFRRSLPDHQTVLFIQ